MTTATTIQAQALNPQAQEIFDLLKAAGYKARAPFRPGGPQGGFVVVSDPVHRIEGRHVVQVEYKDHIIKSPAEARRFIAERA